MWKDYKSVQDRKRQQFVAFVPMSNPDADVVPQAPNPPNPVPVSVEDGAPPPPTPPTTGNEKAIMPTVYQRIVTYSEDYMIETTDKNQDSGFQSGGLDVTDSQGPGYYPPFNRNNKPIRYYEARPYPPPYPRGKRGWESECHDIENKKPRVSFTASQLINEKTPGLVYKFYDQIGPSQDPLFECTVLYTPNGKQYTGTGRSKKLAKCIAAESILIDLGIPIPEKEVKEKSSKNQQLWTPPQGNDGQPHPALLGNHFANFPPASDVGGIPPAIDFSSDYLPGIIPGGAPLYPNKLVTYIEPKKLKRLGNVNINENACCALYAYLGSAAVSGYGIKYDFVSENGPPHEKVFQMKVSFQEPVQSTDQTLTETPMIEKSFIGTGGSKKKAKQDAAKQALIVLIGVQNFAYLQQCGRMPPKRNPLLK